MATKDAFYVPCLRWRQAEYQALLALSDRAKDSIVPLITIPDLEFDFEDGTPKKTVGEHVGTFPKRYKEKWTTRKAWIDADPNIQTEVMADGRPVFTFVFDEILTGTGNPVVTGITRVPGGQLVDVVLGNRDVGRDDAVLYFAGACVRRAGESR